MCGTELGYGGTTGGGTGAYAPTPPRGIPLRAAPYWTPRYASILRFGYALSGTDVGDAALPGSHVQTDARIPRGCKDQLRERKKGARCVWRVRNGADSHDGDDSGGGGERVCDGCAAEVGREGSAPHVRPGLAQATVCWVLTADMVEEERGGGGGGERVDEEPAGSGAFFPT
eukprot:2972816-Rhodomonas_salina.1